MKKYFLLTVILVSALKSYSTCVVFYYTGHSILIAADSKVNFYIGGKVSKSITTCKILSQHDVYFANAGSLYFQIGTLADSSFLQSFNVPSMVDNFIARVQKSIPAILKIMKREEPSEYSQNLTNQAFPTVFCYYKNNYHIIRYVYFTVIDQGSRPPKLIPHIQDISKIIVIGRKNKIEESGLLYLPSVSDSYAYLRQLINLEIIDQPASVGPPISMVELSNSGTNWIDNKKGCAF